MPAPAVEIFNMSLASAMEILECDSLRSLSCVCKAHYISIWHACEIAQTNHNDTHTHAQLQKISDGLGECLNLKRLYLGENMISKLPESMALLTRLTILDLR